jgi:hypothetical protein
LTGADRITHSDSYLLAGRRGPSTGSPPAGDSIQKSQLVQPTENGSSLWPYTSRETSVDQRTLAIDLIIHGDDAQVRKTLMERPSLDWREQRDDDEQANGSQAGPNATLTPGAAVGTEAPNASASGSEDNETAPRGPNTKSVFDWTGVLILLGVTGWVVGLRCRCSGSSEDRPDSR